MSIALSVNLNKLALIRNSRDGNYPNILEFAQLAIENGADGITLHPRSDGRHIRPDDVHAIQKLLKNYPNIELNIEGNPNAHVFGQEHLTMIEFVLELKPHQFTLVPDNDTQLTSDSGWNVKEHEQNLSQILGKLKNKGIRSSVFMDADSDEFSEIALCGADRVELYTGPYALGYPTAKKDEVFQSISSATRKAVQAGMGVNAGHDLNLDNLSLLATLSEINEVSIGHALTVDALNMGFVNAIKAYKKLLIGN